MKIIDHKDNTDHFPVAIVVSRFNESISQSLLAGALRRLEELKFPTSLITVVHVPGAIEIPLIAQSLAERNQQHAIIALGAVINGETDHYKYVCDQVSKGCQHVSLEYQIPVLFGLITAQTEELALDRARNDNTNKGYQVIDAAREMVGLMDELLPG